MCRRRALTALAGVAAAAVLLNPAAAAGPARQPYEVSWTLRESTFPYDGNLADGERRTLRFDLREPNATELEVTLLWKDSDSSGLSRPDAFLLEVTGPGGRLVPESPERGDEGRLQVTARGINPVPARRSFLATDNAEAREALRADEGQEGLGVWKVVVALEDAGNPPGASVDAGNEYRVVVKLRYYVASLMHVVSLEKPPLVSAAGARSGWFWAASALGAVSVFLGGALLWGAVRRRPGRDR